MILLLHDQAGRGLAMRLFDHEPTPDEVKRAHTAMLKQAQKRYAYAHLRLNLVRQATHLTAYYLQPGHAGWPVVAYGYDGTGGW